MHKKLEQHIIVTDMVSIKSRINMIMALFKTIDHMYNENELDEKICSCDVLVCAIKKMADHIECEDPIELKIFLSVIINDVVDKYYSMKNNLT